MLKRFFVSCILMSVFAPSAHAQDKTAEQWLQTMSESHHQLNYRMPIIHLERDHVKSYVFEHGIVDEQQVLYIASLSGPMHHSYRINDVVTYADAPTKPYSVKSNKIVGPSLAIFVDKTEQISANYSFTLAGKGRVAGRIAQLVRLKSKDKNRFNYILWLDLQTSLLLRYDMYDLNNNLIEQIQAVELQLSDKPSEKLVHLKSKEQPALSVSAASASSRWKFNWLPAGFTVQAVDSHRLIHTSQPVDYLLLSDGLSQVSVYVAKAGEIALPEQVKTRNGIAIANFRRGNVEMTVVGRIPYTTAQKIAHAIEPK
ncbi:MAG: MucB/RseB C-terminal domain-containing protein [Psychrobium sp.]|nr:MucB/RseB C-terminal domain-containing protein [Psychrobium sp.]